MRDDSPSLTVDGACAVVRFERPAARNRIEPGDLAVLNAHLDAVERDDGVRALVLTGSGTTFSGGFDLRALEAGDASDGRHGASAFETLANRVEDLPLPTVCALNGGAYGGAVDLALACDVRIGVPDMHVRVPAAELGIHFYPGGLRRFVERLGLDAAKRVFLFAQTYDAAALLAAGYLHEVVSPESLLPRAAEFAAALAPTSRTTVRDLKAALNAVARGGHDEAASALAFAESLRSEETAERLRAFRVRRGLR